MIGNFSAISSMSIIKLGDAVVFVSHYLDSIGFAFVYMEEERDADDAIRRIDRMEFGRKGRRLRVEWTKVLCFVLLK